MIKHNDLHSDEVEDNEPDSDVPGVIGINPAPEESEESAPKSNAGGALYRATHLATHLGLVKPKAPAPTVAAPSVIACPQCGAPVPSVASLKTHMSIAHEGFTAGDIAAATAPDEKIEVSRKVLHQAIAAHKNLSKAIAAKTPDIAPEEGE